MSIKPYSKSTASPAAAEQRIKALLRKFGVQMVSITDDYEHKIIFVIFKHRGLPVKIPITYGILADKWIEETPYTSRRRITKAQHEENIRETAYSAAFSIMEDLLKALITMVDMGVRTFEEAFLADFVMENEQRMGEIMVPKLKALTTNSESGPGSAIIPNCRSGVDRYGKAE